MKKLTAEECRILINGLSSNRSIREDKYLAALEIALPVLEQQGNGNDGWKIVPMELTDEMMRGIVPCMAHSPPLSHDEYDYKGRNERFIKWVWKKLIELAPKPGAINQIENDGREG